LISFAKQAKIKYGDGNFEILESGSYVLCAISGVQIPLDQLKYWSVERQEPYATPEAALQGHVKETK